jgi:hypothetical protein
MANKQKLDWPLCNVDTAALIRMVNVAAWLEHTNVEFRLVDGIISDLHKYENFLSEEDYQILDNLKELATRLHMAICELEVRRGNADEMDI